MRVNVILGMLLSGKNESSRGFIKYCVTMERMGWWSGIVSVCEVKGGAERKWRYLIVFAAPSYLAPLTLIKPLSKDVLLTMMMTSHTVLIINSQRPSHFWTFFTGLFPAQTQRHMSKTKCWNYNLLIPYYYTRLPSFKK